MELPTLSNGLLMRIVGKKRFHKQRAVAVC